MLCEPAVVFAGRGIGLASFSSCSTSADRYGHAGFHHRGDFHDVPIREADAAVTDIPAYRIRAVATMDPHALFVQRDSSSASGQECGALWWLYARP